MKACGVKAECRLCISISMTITLYDDSYKMNVIPNKECILIIHKFELDCIFRIKSDSSSAEFARYEHLNIVCWR